MNKGAISYKVLAVVLVILLVGIAGVVAVLTMNNQPGSVQKTQSTQTAGPSVSAGLATNPPSATAAPKISVYPVKIHKAGETLWGLINASGAIVVEPKYTRIDNFQLFKYAKVYVAGSLPDQEKAGMIDGNGFEVIPPVNDGISDFANGMCIVTKGGAMEGVDEFLNSKFKISAKYINDFSDGLAGISFDDKKVGFINKEGEIVIKPKYSSVSQFKDGMCAVSTKDYNYDEIIDKKGKTVLEKADYYFYEIGEEMVGFIDTDYKLGVMDLLGNIIVPAKFDTFSGFQNGVAIVQESYKSKLIDDEGNYIKIPKNGGIEALKGGIFKVAQVMSDSYSDIQFAKCALFDKSGAQLTGFKYNNLTETSAGVFSVSEGDFTFFIDKSGNPLAPNLKLKGFGTLLPVGDLIQANLDGFMFYYDNNGQLIWSENKTENLPNQLDVHHKVKRFNSLTLIEYPEISGLIDSKVAAKINSKLKDLFFNYFSRNKGSEGSVYYGSMEVDFSSKLTGNLLTITANGYDYPLGAAHGMSILDFYHFNIKDGEMYQLDDLFVKTKNYEDILLSLIKKQALKHKDMYFDVKSITLTGKPIIFDITSSSITIHFSPYEIAPYALGYPSFKVKFTEIDSLIDKNGGLWKALMG